MYVLRPHLPRRALLFQVGSRASSHSLFSTVCRVVNQLTLRPQRGDYELRPVPPLALHDTTVTTTLADSYPGLTTSICQRNQTHTRDPWANIEKCKVFFLILIYATNFDNLLRTECIFHTHTHTPVPNSWGGRWVGCMVSGLFKCLLCCWFYWFLLLMDFPFFSLLKLHWLRVVP